MRNVEAEPIQVQSSPVSLLTTDDCSPRTTVNPCADCDIFDAKPHADEDGNSGASESEVLLKPTIVSIFTLCESYPTPRLLRDPTDDLDLHIRRLGANVSEVLVSILRSQFCPKQPLTLTRGTTIA